MTVKAGVNLCGVFFFVSVAHPFLGASPDALIQCDCCGEGVVGQTSLRKAALELMNSHGVF